MNYYTDEQDELRKLCSPLIEYLKNKHPHYSITVDTDNIKLNEAVIGVPLFVPDGVDIYDYNPSLSSWPSQPHVSEPEVSERSML